jgi:hypothetical protein
MPLLSYMHYANAKVAAGVWTTVTASDTIPATVVQLGHVEVVVVSFAGVLAPTSDPCYVTGQPGAEPGTIEIKTWRNPGAPTPSPATTFGARVHWVAMGT